MRLVRGSSEPPPPAPPTGCSSAAVAPTAGAAATSANVAKCFATSSEYHERSGLRRLQVPFKLDGVSMGSQGSLDSSDNDTEQQQELVIRSLRKSRKNFQGKCGVGVMDAIAAPFGGFSGNVGKGGVFYRTSNPAGQQRRRRASSVSNIAAKFEALSRGEEEMEDSTCWDGGAMSLGSSSLGGGQQDMSDSEAGSCNMVDHQQQPPKSIKVKIKCRKIYRRRDDSEDDPMRGECGGAEMEETAAKHSSPQVLCCDSMADESEAEIARIFQDDDDDDDKEMAEVIADAGGVAAMEEAEEEGREVVGDTSMQEQQEDVFAANVETVSSFVTGQTVITTTMSKDEDSMVWDQFVQCHGDLQQFQQDLMRQQHCQSDDLAKTEDQFGGMEFADEELIEVDPEQVHYHDNNDSQNNQQSVFMEENCDTRKNDHETFVETRDDNDQGREEVLTGDTDDAYCPAFDALFVKTVVLDDDDDDQELNNMVEAIEVAKENAERIDDGEKGKVTEIEEAKSNKNVVEADIKAKASDEGFSGWVGKTPSKFLDKHMLCSSSFHSRITEITTRSNTSKTVTGVTQDHDDDQTLKDERKCEEERQSNLDLGEEVNNLVRQETACTNYSEETFFTCADDHVEEASAAAAVEDCQRQVVMSEGLDHLKVIICEESGDGNGNAQATIEDTPAETSAESEKHVSVQERVQFWKDAFSKSNDTGSTGNSGSSCDRMREKRARNLTIDYHDLAGASSSTWSWNGQVARYLQKSYSPAVAEQDNSNSDSIEEGIGHGLGIILDKLRNIETKLDEIKTMEQNGVWCPEVEAGGPENVVSRSSRTMPELGPTPTDALKDLKDDDEDQDEYKLPPAPSTTPSLESERGGDEDLTLINDARDDDAIHISDLSSESSTDVGSDNEDRKSGEYHVTSAVDSEDNEEEEKRKESLEMKLEILTEEQRMARIEEIAARILMEKRLLAKQEELDKGLDTLSERSEEENGEEKKKTEEEEEEEKWRKNLRERRLSRRTRSASRDRASGLAKIR